MTKKRKENNKGFTLVELMTVMAIIGILASAIMISLGVQKKRATVNKVLTEASGVMENIYLCKSDDGTVKDPTPQGNGAVCQFSDSDNFNYGKWPDVSAGNLGAGIAFTFNVDGNLNSGSWAYGLTPPSGSNMETICCNSLSGKCGKVSGNCDTHTEIN